MIELIDYLAHLGAAAICKHGGTNHGIAEYAVSSNTAGKVRLQHLNALPAASDTGINWMRVAKSKSVDNPEVQVGIDTAVQAYKEDIDLVDFCNNANQFIFQVEKT